jgi:hypothetical protein
MSKSIRKGPAARVGLGHPRREARRQRAAERLAAHVCGPRCKRFRKVATP